MYVERIKKDEEAKITAEIIKNEEAKRINRVDEDEAGGSNNDSVFMLVRAGHNSDSGDNLLCHTYFKPRTGIVVEKKQRLGTLC